MFKKTHNLELSARTSSEEENTKRMKAFHLSHIDSWGLNWNNHSLVTMHRRTIARVLYYDELYRKIINVPGCILEFGVQWGATLAQLIALRGLYEPYNHRRHIYGFDTFKGFVNTDKERDGNLNSDGDYTVTKGYKENLEKILTLHEENCPISHIKKFSLVKGDASVTSKQWVDENPHAIVAMAIFDMDLYKPTRDALKAIMPRLTKGSLLVFDELNCSQFPGETEAVYEVLGLNTIKLQKHPLQPNCAWAVWGDV